MSKGAFSIASMILGLVLLGLSIYWASSDAPPMGFTQAEAEAYIQEGGRLHDMSFKTKPQGNAKEAEVSAEALEAQRLKYEEQKANLASARSGTQWTRWLLMGFGLIFTVGGLFAYKLTSD
jgi:hypothetical protein